MGYAMAPSIITSRKQAKQYHVVVARETLARYQAAGELPDPIRRVDGKVGKPDTAVRWGGYIAYYDRIDMADALEAIYRRLVEKSPVLSGDYSHAHVFMVNGRVLPLELAKEHDVVSIVNVQPYARKIEHGLSMMAPTGVYRLVARWAQQKYRYLDIKFTYIRLPTLGVTFLDRRASKRASRRKPTTVRTPIVYPIIHIRAVPR